VTEGGIVPHLRARELRWNMTDAERVLWSLLRRKQLAGYRFRRQATLDPYIADFFCPKARVIVELDGSDHGRDDQRLRDEMRTRYLERNGCHVVRFWNRDVFMRPDEVVDAIHHFITDHPPSGAASPRHLPPQGGKGKTVA
jgi:very-short-patch-repair endonuclease